MTVCARGSRVLSLAGVLAAWVTPAHGAPTSELRAVFPYRDAEFLSPGETGGGLAIVPGEVAAGARAPLVVLLHGVDMDQTLHMWLGARNFPDLAALAGDEIRRGALPPFILAAPSQTKNAASGHRMWEGFDLDDFVRAVDAAVGGRATIDREAVIVIGHSGGGCNPQGGLLRVARAPSLIVPRALLAIDTCMDEESGAALGSAPSSAAVWVRWQTEIWPRPIDRFRAAFTQAAATSGHEEGIFQAVTGLTEPVHEMILADTFTTVLPKLLRAIPVRPGPD